MADIKFEIVKHLATLSENAKGWTRELNLVSWNSRKAKLDIRDWDENHEKMGKGITLNREEAESLLNSLKEADFDSLDID